MATEANVTQRQTESLPIAPEKPPRTVEGDVYANRKIWPFLSTCSSANWIRSAALLNTQMEDGSWYVKTRALAVQPYFDNGFPHGVDQWISAAGTSWATMALTLASHGPAPGSTSVAQVHW